MAESEALRDLLPVLASLSRWLKDQQISYAIIGGVAIGFLAQPRATQDVDAVAWIDFDHLQDFLESGKAFGFVPRISDPIDFAKKARVILLRHQQTNIGIDLSCGALLFEREMLDRSTELTAGPITFRIATPEDLIILKAVAHRQRDLIDIDNLLTVQSDVDFERIRYWVRQFAEVLDSPELLSDLERILADHNRPAKA
jgi:predicted nucleotidyltransferase